MGSSVDPDPGFLDRHLGSDHDEIRTMLESLGFTSLDEMVDATVPASIRMEGQLDLPDAVTERELLLRLRDLGAKNLLFRSYLGMGYHGTVVPGVIKRNVL